MVGQEGYFWCKTNDVTELVHVTVERSLKQADKQLLDDYIAIFYTEGPKQKNKKIEPDQTWVVKHSELNKDLLLIIYVKESDLIEIKNPKQIKAQIRKFKLEGYLKN